MWVLFIRSVCLWHHILTNKMSTAFVIRDIIVISDLKTPFNLWIIIMMSYSGSSRTSSCPLKLTLRQGVDMKILFWLWSQKTEMWENGERDKKGRKTKEYVLMGWFLLRIILLENKTLGCLSIDFCLSLHEHCIGVAHLTSPGCTFIWLSYFPQLIESSTERHHGMLVKMHGTVHHTSSETRCTEGETVQFILNICHR